MCWTGTGADADAAFDAYVRSTRAAFIAAAGLEACGDAISFQIIPPSVFESTLCAADSHVLVPDELLAREKAGNPVVPMLKLSQFDAVMVATNTDIAGPVKGMTDRSGRFWTEYNPNLEFPTW
jgi:hypothetical protein